jgi:hypothetical protein
MFKHVMGAVLVTLAVAAPTTASVFDAGAFRQKAVELDRDVNLTAELIEPNIMKVTRLLSESAYYPHATLTGSILSAAELRGVLCQGFDIGAVLKGKSAVILYIRSRPTDARGLFREARLDTFTNCKDSYPELTEEERASLEEFVFLSGAIYTASAACNFRITAYEDAALVFAYEQWLNPRMQGQLRAGMATQLNCFDRSVSSLRDRLVELRPAVGEIRKKVGGD